MRNDFGKLDAILSEFDVCYDQKFIAFKSFTFYLLHIAYELRLNIRFQVFWSVAFRN